MLGTYFRSRVLQLGGDLNVGGGNHAVYGIGKNQARFEYVLIP